MTKGDKVYINGQPFIVEWSSDDMTPEERRESARKAGALMRAFGIEPMSLEILNAEKEQGTN